MLVEQKGHFHRWRNAEPVSVRVGEIFNQGTNPFSAKGHILSVYCNDTHVFCAQGNGKLGVYNLESGQLVRELAQSAEEMTGTGNLTDVVGSQEVVAAATNAPEVVVWSSKGDMEKIHSLNLHNYSCSDDSCEHPGVRFIVRSIQMVDCTKVAILLEQNFLDQQDYIMFKISLILLEKVASTWENMNLGCFNSSLPWHWHPGTLASDSTWLALLVWEEKKIKVWRGNELKQDIFLTKVDDNIVGGNQVDMFIQMPHIILNVRRRTGNALIKVYKIESAGLHLLKSIHFGIDGWLDCRRSIANRASFGFVETIFGEAKAVHVFEKGRLLTTDLSPEETQGRRFEVESNETPVAMNTTCLLSFFNNFDVELFLGGGSFDSVEQEMNKTYLMKKKDFWM